MATIHAQAPDSSAGTVPPPSRTVSGVDRLEFDLPVFDAPFNGIGGGYTFPSMAQSLALTKGLAQGFHWTLANYAAKQGDRSGKRTLLSFGALFTEFALITLPGGYTWLHEEWHRAVLTGRHIGSYNGVYDFRILSNAIPVSRVADADLVSLKRSYPADMVRLSAAGNEAQLELARSLRRELFFNRQECSLEWITLFINTFSPASYLFLCSMPYADQLTDRLERAEGSDISRRDIVGMDFTAWVYDLHRPREPYDSGRGAHPSGVGIRRYIRRSQLTAEEKNYLQLQGFLAWLNLLNPQLAGKNRFNGKSPFTKTPYFWNAAIVHHLTPFGFTIDGDLMAAAGTTNAAATLHSYFNGRRYFPGAAVEVDDLPLSIFGARGAFPRLYVSAQAEGWLQPKGLLFDERAAQPGGALAFSLKAGVTKRLLVSAGASGKSAGWQAGRVSLDRQLGAHAGLCLWLADRRSAAVIQPP
ncbi:MAG: hypothetical protein JW699_01875 [Chitinispirillaceae bacterium]|nr:hypothetical protein [Chitinispirillaceae bacterium]